MHGHRAVLSPRRKARQPQKAGKRGAGVARAFTSAQPQLAGPFAEKEEQGSGATAAFLRQMHLPKAKKTPEQSGLCSDVVEATPGIEPGNEDFADPCLTAWLCRRRWSGRRGSNPPPQPWQGCALPNELLPQIRRPCGGMMVGTPSGARTLDTLIKSQVLYQLS